MDQPDTQPEAAADDPDTAPGSAMQWPWPFETAEPEPPVRVLQDPAKPGKTQWVRVSDFVGKAIIAQCPHCADFRINASPRAPLWWFACQACGLEWSWEPGTPWPEVHVRPEERRFSDRY